VSEKTYHSVHNSHDALVKIEEQPMSITIVGLGPGDPAHLTREAWEVLKAADEVHLRTRHHPTVPALPQGLTLHTFDRLYEEADDFEEIYTAIAAEILSLGRRPQGVIYAVPGHPLVGEASVGRILDVAREADLPLRVVAGLSFVEPVLTALGIDALSGLQLVDATELAAMHHPPLNPDLPALVAQLYSQPLAADLKLTLMNQYPPEHSVVLVHSAGTVEEQTVTLPLYELDRQPDVAHLTTLYLPPLPQVSSFEGFQETIAHLRAPEGCPWDREQTHQSLRSNLLEEAYEVLTALDQDDVEALREELGDLLLQIVLHAQIAVEAGEFSMADVIATVDAKIKHRHPHVWGERVVSGAEEVVRNWEALKAQERREKADKDGRSIFDDVPLTLPALVQADVYGRRAARVGFDWPDVGGVVEKVGEEIEELRAAGDDEERMVEMGDLLFAVVNWARWLDVDPESALRQANARFARRFAWVEAEAGRRNLDLMQLDLDELEALWQAAKKV
jgi:tetrapyrrole methylase family protein/MazG family protein